MLWLSCSSRRLGRSSLLGVVQRSRHIGVGNHHIGVDLVVLVVRLGEFAILGMMGPAYIRVLAHIVTCVRTAFRLPTGSETAASPRGHWGQLLPPELPPLSVLHHDSDGTHL